MEFSNLESGFCWSYAGQSLELDNKYICLAYQKIRIEQIMTKYSFIPKKETFKTWSPGLGAGMRNIPIGGNHENGPCVWKDEEKQKCCRHVKPVRADMQKRVSNLEWWCVSGRASLRQVGDWLSLLLLVDVLLSSTYHYHTP